MSVVAIIGLQWGDEGKGKIVDWLSSQAVHVARFQGGHNAGHTLIVGGKQTILHLLPSGILHAGVKCYIGGGVVVSPTALLAEMKTLGARGVSLLNRFYLSHSAALVMPHHAIIDEIRENEAGGRNIGTTRLGIGPAHEDKTGRRAVRLYDLYNGAGRDKLEQCIKISGLATTEETKPAKSAKSSKTKTKTSKALDVDALWKELQLQARQLRPFVTSNVGELLYAAKERGESILLEGAQGVMLDIEQGTYPFVTSAQCLPAAAASGLGVELSPQVLGVTKAYTTRVGNGPFPTQADDDNAAKLSKLGGEVGATTGRQRRCGWLDLPMLRHALRVTGCERLALTKLDVLDSFAEIPVCTAYELDGERIHLPPLDPLALERCKPVYENLPGWRGKTTAGLTDEKSLPPKALKYINTIEKDLNVSVDIISTSPDREASIVRRHPFPKKGSKGKG